MSSRVRVWWIPQVPGKPFLFGVPSIDHGVMLCDALARYDLFQYENRIKPDYANVGGISILHGGEWTDLDPDDQDSLEEAHDLLALPS